LTSGEKTAANRRLKQAVRRNRAFSTQGLLEFLFTLAFKGLVYPQIWEDPDVDMEALAISPDCHVVAIASGGCNVLSYLIADPARITAVDLARPHVALNRLKLAAARHLPTWQSFYRFFGEADTDANVAAYWRFLSLVLTTKPAPIGKGGTCGVAVASRCFSRNVYRCGLLGHSIGLGHLLARLHGVDLRQMPLARLSRSSGRSSRRRRAPLFDKPLVRWATGGRMSLYGLGIPPAQYAAPGRRRPAHGDGVA
jgi:S-adenosylmethionine-diacylglycerol 3-amino-3-carboxypropyl transferase